MRLALLVLALVATTGCGALTGRPLESWAQDRGLTARVKTRLVAVDPASLTRIHVDTYDRIIYLTGGVANGETKRRAEQVARGVSGVEQVVNNIHVTGEGALAAVDVSASPAMAPPRRGGGAGGAEHPLLQRFPGLARMDLQTGTPGWTRYVARDAAGRVVATVYSFPAGELARNPASGELTGTVAIDHVSVYRDAAPGAVQYDLVLWHVSRDEVARLE